eukprot:365142-Chlamydomonas_euryale.AAC.3
MAAFLTARTVCCRRDAASPEWRSYSSRQSSSSTLRRLMRRSERMSVWTCENAHADCLHACNICVSGPCRTVQLNRMPDACTHSVTVTLDFLDAVRSTPSDAKSQSLQRALSTRHRSGSTALPGYRSHRV